MTNEQNELAVSLYEQGMNSVGIASQLGVTSSTIQALFKKIGIKLNGNSKGSIKVYFDEQTKERIIDLYKAGNSSGKILSLLSLDNYCTDNTIRKVIAQGGVEIRKRGNVSRTINEDFFEKIDSEKKAYYLGLIITDGYILHQPSNRKRSKILGIELKESDRYILEDLSKTFSKSKKISYKPKKNTCILTITSNKICEDLAKYGVCPRKTHTVGYPNLNDESLNRHMMRGIFDGDGTVFVSNGNIKFGLYGNKEIVYRFRDILEKELNVNKVKITDKVTVQQLTYSSKKDVLNFYRYIYKDANYYIKRKKELFENQLC